MGCVTDQRAARWFAAACLGGALAGCADKPDPPTVVLHGVTWRVELAVNDAQRSRGLGGRASLADDRGMLFLFDDTRVRGFWMKDCRIPLDIAFLDEERRVVQIHTMAVEPAGRPLSEYRSYSSGVPAKYALEVPAGALGRAGVRVGEKAAFAGDFSAWTHRAAPADGPR